MNILSKYLFIVCLLVVPAWAPAQDNCGCFNRTLVENAMPEKVDAEKRYASHLKHLEDSDMVLGTQLQCMYTEISCQMTQQEIKNLEITSRNKNLEIENFRENAQQRLLLEKQVSDSLIKTRLMALIKTFMQKNNLVHLADQEKLIACTGCKDYTPELIDYVRNLSKKD